MDVQESMRESQKTKVSSNDIGLSEPFFQKNIESTINKWIDLQNILKESQSLQKIIEKQHLTNYEQMVKCIYDFYDLKIKERKIYEDIKFLKMHSEGIDITSNKDKEFYVTKLSGNYLGIAVEPIERLMSIIRDNYDYIPKIVSLIDEKDSKQEIESLAEFFCNQFYNNIFIKNNEDELLICIYKLLEQEINQMDFVDIDNFLEESSFIGKFMTVFSKKQELNNFLSNLLNKVLKEVDKRNSFVMDLSLNKIMEHEEIKENIMRNKSEDNVFENKMEKNSEKKGIDPIEKILQRIPNSKINFKKFLEIENEIFRESQISTSELSSLFNENIEFDIEEDLKDEIKSSEYNNYYLKDLNKNFLSQKLNELSDPDLLSFYKYLINQLDENYHNPNAFANTSFFLTLKDNYYFEQNNIIAEIYLKNFLFIQEQIEVIIQSLIDKMTTIPYSVRCICTIIDFLINKKFPKLHKYIRHSFIGKFLFNKLIFPFLNLENTYELKTNIFNQSQINCLNCIISVISNANKCKLFDIYNDIEKTMFNYYLLDIIPILQNFYDKLVDMQLSSQLNDFINQSDNDNKIFNIENNHFLFKNEIKDEKFENDDDKNKQNYDYFKENMKEIIRFKSVCFNEKDICFILRLINKNIELFKNLPEYKRFKLSIGQKSMNEEELEIIIKEQKEIRKEKNIDHNNKGEGYFIFTYNEQNSELNFKLKDFYSEEKKKQKKEESLLSRMKNSIKTILIRINLLNKKDYPLLNFSISNEKFFQIINLTFRDFKEVENEIPLNWHIKYIINNKNQLDNEYIKNDFEKLYEEIYLEENNFLNKLKSLSPLINLRESMNLNCAENAIDNVKLQINILEKTKQLEKVKIFISQDKTEVCINLKENINNIGLSYSKTFSKNSFKNIENKTDYYINVEPINKCIHHSINFLDKMKGRNKHKIYSHIKSVNEFINTIIKPNNFVNESILEYIKEDIKTGKATHKIYSLFIQYKTILKQSLIRNYKELIEDENDSNEITEKIEEHIIRKIYKYVFPPEPLLEDKSFNYLTKSYDWIQTSDFSLKDNIPLEAIQDSVSYLIEMEERAYSIYEKINCLKMVYNNINKINEFFFNKKDKSADAQTPIFNYIIIKTHPKRLISNINYLNCFTDSKNRGDIYLYIKNCSSSIEFIFNLTPESFNLTEKEFNNRCKESTRKFFQVNKLN